MKAIRTTFGLLLVLAGVIIAGLFFFDSTGPASSAPATLIDYLADVDAATAPTLPEEDAWPLYRHVLADLSTPPYQGPSSAFGESRSAMLTWARSHEDLLEPLLEASSRKFYGQPYHPKVLLEGWRDFWMQRGDAEKAREAEQELELYPQETPQALWTARLPPWEDVLCRLWEFLKFSSYAAEEDQDLEAALIIVEAVHRLGEQLLARGTALETAMSIALLTRGSGHFRNLLWNHPMAWDDHHWERLRKSPYVTWRPAPLKDLIKIEWLVTLDALQRVFVDSDIHLGGFLSRGGSSPIRILEDLRSKALLHVHVDYDETLRRIEVLRDAALAGHPPPPPPKQLLGKYRSSLVQVLDPTHWIADLRKELDSSVRQHLGSGVTIALLQYQDERGELPKKLMDLPAELLNFDALKHWCAYAPEQPDQLLVDVGWDRRLGSGDDVVLIPAIPRN
jgi:hypothetical protein